MQCSGQNLKHKQGNTKLELLPVMVIVTYKVEEDRLVFFFVSSDVAGRPKSVFMVFSPGGFSLSSIRNIKLSSLILLADSEDSL